MYSKKQLNELGITPIRLVLWKRKLSMWWRLNQENTNTLLRNCKKVQINRELPWISGITKIAVELGIDLEKAKITSKQGWKDQVKNKLAKRGPTPGRERKIERNKQAS